MNRNFQTNLGKLAFILNQSSRFNNKHKKNYNAAAILLTNKLKRRVNRGNIQGNQKNNFKKQYYRFLSLVLQNARSPLAPNIAVRPYEMKAKFNRKGTNRFLNFVAGKPSFKAPAYVPTGHLYFGRKVNGARRPVPNKCVFKKLSIFGAPICK